MSDKICEAGTPLFQSGSFTLSNGATSGYKIECDALTWKDWAGVAAMITEEKLLPPFCGAVGVPRGGRPLAAAMQPYCTENRADPILICEDVLTTGTSMEKYRQLMTQPPSGRPESGYIGVVLFARGPCPGWIVPVFLQTRRAA